VSAAIHDACFAIGATLLADHHLMTIYCWIVPSFFDASFPSNPRLLPDRPDVSTTFRRPLGGVRRWTGCAVCHRWLPAVRLAFVRRTLAPLRSSRSPLVLDVRLLPVGPWSLRPLPVRVPYRDRTARLCLYLYASLMSRFFQSSVLCKPLRTAGHCAPLCLRGFVTNRSCLILFALCLTR